MNIGIETVFNLPPARTGANHFAILLVPGHATCDTGLRGPVAERRRGGGELSLILVQLQAGPPTTAGKLIVVPSCGWYRQTEFLHPTLVSSHRLM